MMTELFLLLLLLTANGSPIVARLMLGDRLDRPLDGGRMMADGHPLLGPSKTLRGLVSAIVGTVAAAPLLGFSWQIGLLIAIFAMLGDIFSSFLKRRLGLASSAMALGLDQIPESLFPLVACRSLLDLSVSQVLLLTFVFMIAELLISRLLYQLGIRQHPY